MEELLEKLILELKESRESFSRELKETRASLDRTASSIKWTKINTIILYCLVAIVFILGSFGFTWYLDEKHDSCVEHNEIRASAEEQLDETAFAVGVALQVVSGADQEKLDQYLATYIANVDHSDLQERPC